MMKVRDQPKLRRVGIWVNWTSILNLRRQPSWISDQHKQITFVSTVHQSKEEWLWNIFPIWSHVKPFWISDRQNKNKNLLDGHIRNIRTLEHFNYTLSTENYKKCSLKAMLNFPLKPKSEIILRTWPSTAHFCQGW